MKDWEGTWLLYGCQDDIAIIHLKSDGHFALVANDKVISTTINGVQQQVESNGTGYLTVRLLDILYQYPTVKSIDQNYYYEMVRLPEMGEMAAITKMNWKVDNDTLIVCSRTPSSSYPTAIEYEAAGRTYKSTITNEFFFKINGAYSKNLDMYSLKNGDVLQVGKPKGVDAYNFPICSKETLDTLFSQKITVKLVNTTGRLATQLESTYDVCKGDTLLLSQFYSQCIGYYMKDGQQISTTLWVDPTTTYYHPYKQTRITVPGTYYLSQTPMLGCGEDYYGCPATSKDIVVKEKVHCMVTDLLEKRAEKTRPLYYPNPTEGELSIQTEKKGTWELLNLQGQVLKSIQVETGIHSIQLSEFSAGVYLCRFNVGDKVFYQKLTKVQ